MCVRQRMSFEPQRSGHPYRMDPGLLPPLCLVPAAVHFAMVAAAQGNREFVADFPAKSTALRKSQVMRVGRASPADEARLLGDEPEMRLVANATWLLKRECALVDGLGAGRPTCFGGSACQDGDLIGTVGSMFY